MLSDQAIDEYRELCQKHYGVVLTRDEARGQAERFLELCKFLVKPHKYLLKKEVGNATKTKRA